MKYTRIPVALGVRLIVIITTARAEKNASKIKLIKYIYGLQWLKKDFDLAIMPILLLFYNGL